MKLTNLDVQATKWGITILIAGITGVSTHFTMPQGSTPIKKNGRLNSNDDNPRGKQWWLYEPNLGMVVTASQGMVMPYEARLLGQCGVEAVEGPVPASAIRPKLARQNGCAVVVWG